VCSTPPLLSCQAIATIKAIETGWVHPSLNQHNLIDEVSGIDTVPNEKKKHEVREGQGNGEGKGEQGEIPPWNLGLSLFSDGSQSRKRSWPPLVHFRILQLCIQSLVLRM
jgi:hypothetical protein